MKDILKYKEFIGSVHFNSDDEVFYGKIEGVNDLITFEGESVKELLSSFKEAVDDYINLCKSNKKPIYKSYKGSFNVRISPTLHRKAIEKALSLGIPLNQLVQKAIENEVSTSK
jgi:predicted HicB family RNase H-like nuclease